MKGWSGIVGTGGGMWSALIGTYRNDFDGEVGRALMDTGFGRSSGW